MHTRIKELRLKHNLSQQVFAQHIGSNQKTLSRYESGNYDIPASIIVAVSKYCNVTTDYILYCSDNPLT